MCVRERGRENENVLRVRQGRYVAKSVIEEEINRFVPNWLMSRRSTSKLKRKKK